MEKVKLGKYQHYKGKFYEVIAIGKNSETLEEVVIYKGLYNSEEFGNNPVWVRPLSMFLEEVDFNGKKAKRFTFVSE